MTSGHVALGCLLAATAGCGMGPRTPAREAVTILYPYDERIFGPYWSVEAWFLVFLPLVTWDEHGEIAPALARRWERSADARTWTFHLRSDVRWHDGVPTTAHDVKFTLELQARPDVLFDDAWQDLDSIAVPNDTTLVLHYRRGKDARNTWMVYWPRHRLEGLDPRQFWEWEFWTRPVGNGPFRYVRHVPKTMVELEANPDFYAGAPRLERVLFRFGSGSPVTELLSGTVDVAAWITHADLPKMAAHPRFRVFHQLSPEVPWLKVIAWNHRHSMLRDARVRRAIAAAIDRRELVRVQNFPPDLRLADAPYTPRQYRRDALPGTVPHDPVAARTLLEEAGWRDLDGDGVRQRAARPLRFTLLVGDEKDATVAVYLQSVLRRIGVDLVVSQLDVRVLRSRFAAGNFEAAIMPLWNHSDGHARWFGTFAGEAREAPARQGTGYRNPGIARLIDAARTTFDPEGRDRLYAEAAPLFLAEQPVLFLYPEPQAYVVTRRLQGLVPPYRADPVQFLQYLWLENSR